MPVHLAARAWLDRLQGQYGTSLDLAMGAGEAARDQGHAEWTAWSGMFLGSLLLDLGADEEASPILQQGAWAAERSGSDLHGVRCWAKLGQSRLGCEDVAGARDALQRVDDVLHRMVLPHDRTNVFVWDAYVGAALIRAALGDEIRSAPELSMLVE